jgi:hypothetical protein
MPRDIVSKTASRGEFKGTNYYYYYYYYYYYFSYYLFCVVWHYMYFGTA